MRTTRNLFRSLPNFVHARSATPSPQLLYLMNRQPSSLRPSRHLQPLSSCPRLPQLPTRRHQSTSSHSPFDPPPPEPQERAQQPSYELIFTCKPCEMRSRHRISKQGYHRGTVVVSCPSCKSRHIISDHLNIFMDKPTDIEGIMQQHGERVKKGVLGKGREGEDVEFWDDGTETPRYMGQPEAGDAMQQEAGDTGQQDAGDTGQQEAENTARNSP
ncbi:MAG: hypothetical protein Q9160_006454 [Pyrenula sp. 1 TL-2023]